jgi:hypothetical protein
MSSFSRILTSIAVVFAGFVLVSEALAIPVSDVVKNVQSSQSGDVSAQEDGNRLMGHVKEAGLRIHIGHDRFKGYHQRPRGYKSYDYFVFPSYRRHNRSSFSYRWHNHKHRSFKSFNHRRQHRYHLHH